MFLEALVLAAALAAAPHNEFLSTWRAPRATPLDFTGRKVAAVLVVDDHDLRVSAEEALAREITARGVTGVPAYRILPRELLTDPVAARTWFAKAEVQGLVILRLVKTDTQKVYSSVVWSSGYYGNTWDYWGYGWSTPYPIGKAREERIITVEVVLHDLAEAAPVWAAVARTTSPANVQSYVKLLTEDVVERLEKEKVIRVRRP
jgi:hypothetical protein